MGACTADKCSCPGHCIPSEEGRTKIHKPWVQIEFSTGAVIDADELPDLLPLSSNEPEPEEEAQNQQEAEVVADAPPPLADRNARGYFVSSDSESDEVFPIGQVVANVPAPINGRNLPRYPDYYRTYDRFSDDSSDPE